MIKSLQWLDQPNLISSNQIKKVEEIIGIQLPFLYKDVIKDNDGNTPVESSFSYYDEGFGSTIGSGVGAFIPLLDPEDGFLSFYNEPPEFFPEGLIAFAEVGNGDLICFDYRQGTDNPDPSIVYWNHEAEIGKDVSFIATNFEAFLGMLKESED